MIDCFVEKILDKCKLDLDSQEIYTSEDDFKFSFALAAKECSAKKIILEFPIKTKDLYSKNNTVLNDLRERKKCKSFEESKSFIDLSFEYKDVQYFFEFKYKVASLNIKRHGKNFTLANQSAGNIGLYFFHEDIERMESIKDFYSRARTFCILLTNNPFYWDDHKEDSMAYKVSLKDTTKVTNELNGFKIGDRCYRDLQCYNRYATWNENGILFKKIKNQPKGTFKALIIEAVNQNDQNK